MSTIRVNQIQDTSTNVAANISGGVVAFNNTPTFASGADPFNSVVETWYYDTTSRVHANNVALSQVWTRKTDSNTANKNGGMTVSSGQFAFPSTGIWSVNLDLHFFSSQATAFHGGIMQYTSDNSTYNNLLARYDSSSGGNQSIQVQLSNIFNITDIANQKIKFIAGCQHQITIYGGVGINQTLIHFIKLCPSV